MKVTPLLVNDGLSNLYSTDFIFPTFGTGEYEIACTKKPHSKGIYRNPVGHGNANIP